MPIERSRTLAERFGPRSFLQRLDDGNKSRAPFGLLARSYLRERKAEPRFYGRVGNLEVRMACGLKDVRLAQRMRYDVFYKEMSATPNFLAELRRRDEDPYDGICDHLLVVDRAAPSQGQASPRPIVVGTYRLLRQDVASRHFGFYTQGEYDIAPMLARQPSLRFLELGRSCVLKSYRNRRTLELLWHGLWTYVREQRVDVMIGCASFEGTDPNAHAMALSFLHHHARAPQAWHCAAHPHLHRRMDLLPEKDIDMKAALKALPPLIKGYLRLGAFVGDGAVIDHQFGTTDVLIILPVKNIDPRYFEHFGSPDEVKSRIAQDG